MKVIILLLITSGIGILRFYQNRSNRMSSKKAHLKIIEDPTYAKEIASELDWQVLLRKNVVFKRRLIEMENVKIEDITILISKRLTNTNWLIVTLCIDNDIVYNTSNYSRVKKYYHKNYRLETHDDTVKLYSEQYDSLLVKNLTAEWGNVILDYFLEPK